MMRLFGFSFGGDSGRSTHDLLKELENKRIEREIALQEAIQDRKRAYELATAKERFPYLFGGSLIAIVTSAVSAYVHKNILHTSLIPLFGTALLYEAHRCFGNKEEIINKLAQSLRRELYPLPRIPFITRQEVDSRIEDDKQHL